MYTIEYSKDALKTLKRIPRNLTKRIEKKLALIAQNPYEKHNNVKPLVGSSYYRLRVGDWRIIYEIQDGKLIILVLKIRPRGEAYR